MIARTTGRLQRRHLHFGGRRLYARIGGPTCPVGPPVVLISGYVASGRYLAPTAAELAACRAVVVPDLPGVGRSPHGAAPLDVAGLADLVADLIAGLDGPADVVANSFGCQVAVELALRRPGAVHGLVLTSPVVARRMRSLLPLAGRHVQALRRESWSYLGIVLLDLLRGWPRKAVANLRALLGYPVLGRAGRLDVPAVVVRGRRDPLVPDRFARRLAAAVPCGRYVVLDGTHALPYGMPKAVAGLLLDGVLDDRAEAGVAGPSRRATLEA